jgi:peptidoglycan lytic transglycosylase D
VGPTPQSGMPFWGNMFGKPTRWTIAGCLLFALFSCGGEKKPVAIVPLPQATPPTPTLNASDASVPQQPAAPQMDPVDALIAQVESAYQSGKSNYAAGHMEAAKASFDRAFNLLLSSDLELRSDDRLMREFDKVVDGVQALELAALKEGDGFAEQKSEPAPIDEASAVTFPVDPNLRKQAEQSVRVTSSDLPLMVTDEVASYISYYSTRGRPTLEKALIRSGRYRGMILRILREEGVPQDLIYLAQAESGFLPLALSRAGARGMWQFMASRASEYGLKHSWWLDERQDPEKSTRAMAAYDSGPGTVQQAVQRTGYADFWELYRRNVLPTETKNYVPIILAIILMTKNPAQYGLDYLELERPVETESVMLDSPVDLRLVAECVDTTVDKLQELNPSLLRMTTPREGYFELKVPRGTAARLEQVISSVPPDMRVWWRYHRVVPGETLSEIAGKYGTSVSAIREVNDLDSDEVWAEDRLIIPVTPGRSAERERIVYSKTPTRYKVRRGDTLSSIAEDFGVPPEKLRSWNRMKGSTLIAGHTIRIYRPLTGPPAASRGNSRENSNLNRSKSGRILHTVQPGETLSAIADRYNTTVTALRHDNKVTSLIHPGDVLVIPAADENR